MPKRSVFIINTDSMTTAMFRSMGWEITPNPTQAELFQFTGSGNSDVNPQLYGEAKHRKTFPDPGRDKMESIYFDIAKKRGIPMAGICRGGQLLNVLNGGWLWQDVNNHNSPHYITDTDTGETYLVSSAHHQMMRVTRDAVVLATGSESTYREWCRKDGVEGTHCIAPGKQRDIEVVLYPKTKSFCVQYHPEYQGFSALAGRYFEQMEEYLFRNDKGTLCVES